MTGFPKNEQERDTLRSQDIIAKDLERRPFLARVSLLAGTVGASALFAGCGDSDPGGGSYSDTSCRYDLDPHNPVRCDSD